MKEMYLKVKVESNENCDFLDVYYRNGMYFMCHKDDERLVEIEDAEKKGAEKFAESLKYIIGKIKDHAYDEVEKAFPKCDTLGDILTKFIPREINDRVEKIKKPKHVPTTGDIYVSRKSGNKVAVLSYNEETRRVRFMGGSYITNGSVEDFDKMFSFTGCVYDSFYNIVNELYSEEGDNT